MPLNREIRCRLSKDGALLTFFGEYERVLASLYTSESAQRIGLEIAYPTDELPAIARAIVAAGHSLEVYR